MNMEEVYKFVKSEMMERDPDIVSTCSQGGVWCYVNNMWFVSDDTILCVNEEIGIITVDYHVVGVYVIFMTGGVDAYQIGSIYEGIGFIRLTVARLRSDYGFKGLDESSIRYLVDEYVSNKVEEVIFR